VKPSGMGKVGICWFHAGRALGDPITLQEEIDDGNFVYGPFDHMA
jgi:hypothetical protein